MEEIHIIFILLHVTHTFAEDKVTILGWLFNCVVYNKQLFTSVSVNSAGYLPYRVTFTSVNCQGWLSLVTESSRSRKRLRPRENRKAESDFSSDSAYDCDAYDPVKTRLS